MSYLDPVEALVLAAASMSMFEDDGSGDAFDFFIIPSEGEPPPDDVMSAELTLGTYGGDNADARPLICQGYKG